MANFWSSFWTILRPGFEQLLQQFLREFAISFGRVFWLLPGSFFMTLQTRRPKVHQWYHWWTLGRPSYFGVNFRFKIEVIFDRARTFFWVNSAKEFGKTCAENRMASAISPGNRLPRLWAGFRVLNEFSWNSISIPVGEFSANFNEFS